MDQNLVEATHDAFGDSKAIDTWLKGLWDRARKAAELIARLREEKTALEERVALLDAELTKVKEELSRNENALKTLSEQNTVTASQVLLNGERQEISARVKNLLLKLEEYI